MEHSFVMKIIHGLDAKSLFVYSSNSLLNPEFSAQHTKVGSGHDLTRRVGDSQRIEANDAIVAREPSE